MNTANTIHRRVRFHAGGVDKNLLAMRPSGRIPRVAKLLTLAIRMERLIETGAVNDYAEFARLKNVSRARITQITNLVLLAPDIQEAIISSMVIRKMAAFSTESLAQNRLK